MAKTRLPCSVILFSLLLVLHAASLLVARGRQKRGADVCPVIVQTL